MKRIYLLLLSALLTGSTCLAGSVVTFEEFTVNSDGYLNDFGEDSSFSSGGFTFNSNYFPEWSYWSGFAISNRTQTTFTTLTPDQFNSCVGSGVNGSEKYCVVYPQGETIDVEADGGAEISGFYVTNEAWAVDAILNGDGMTPGAFTTGDYLVLKVIGTHPDETTATVEFYLADYRSENEADHYYVNDWQWVNLSSLGTVESITFSIDGSRKNDWGLTTPAYFCMDDFNGTAPAPAEESVVTFEEFTVNSDGYLNDFGEDSSFSSGGFTFNSNYFPEWSYWSGFAISNRTQTTFTTLTPDQFNSCVGSGVNGSEKYCVVYPQGETIDVEADGGAEISGFYVTNEAWAVDAILNGDGMTPGAFTTGDYLVLKVIGTHPDETTATVEFYLADYRSENEADHYYVNDWQWVDLSSLGTVESITFSIDGSRKNDWGLTTPAYFCMDDFNGTAPADNGPATFEDFALDAESHYNGAGAEGETITDSWGSQVTKSQFISGGYRFTTLYNPQWGSWSGFGVSNETNTTYTTPDDQYCSAVGHGYDGSNNYAVAFPSPTGETVEPVNGPSTISGMYVTNNAWTVDAILNGDGLTPGGFTTGDWCKLTITGTHVDESTTSTEVYLADYRSADPVHHYYINWWQWVDLSCLGEVKSVTFTISSSRNNDWGMTTPGYFCLDNFGGEPDNTVGICHPITADHNQSATQVGIYTLDGKQVTMPGNGLHIIRMSDGTTRKVVF